MIQDLQDQADALVGQGEYKLADQRLKRIKELKEQLKHMKDSMDVLKLSGFSVKDGDIILPQHEASDEDVSPKFKKVMEEFGKGELKSSSGEKVTDPKQAKAIAYSEAGESKDAEEQWITMNGAHVKVEEGESKEKASKEFIKKKGGDPAPAKGAKQSQEIKYDEKEIEKIKSRWKGKESVGGYGSEYGDILDHLEQEATKAGTLPDMDEYFKLNDKLIDLRQSGKKDTEEYKSVEKQRNDFNKQYNKVHKALKEKARSLSSESEQKRLGELDKMTKGAKDDDATKEGAIKEYGKEKGSFEDDCGEKVFTKGTEDGYKFEDPREIEAAIKKAKESGHPNPQYIFALERALRLAKAEREQKDACSNKDADPKVAEAEAMISLFGGVR